MMSNSFGIGKPVYAHRHGLLRFGVIEAKMVDKDGWTHFSIRWLEDQQYESSLAWDLETNPNRKIKQFYRCDEVYPLDLPRLNRVSSLYKDQITL